jgi:multidrug efflux system outer membrane protein
VAQLQTAQFITEASVIQLRNAQGANRIRLHLALGGSFDAKPAATLPAPAPEPRPSTKAGT